MIKLKYGASVISLPGAVRDKIGEATGADLRVLIAISGGAASDDEIAAICKMSADDVRGSLAFWRGAGVIEGDSEKKPRGQTPSDIAARVYTGDEIEKICKEDKSIGLLITKCQEILGLHTFTHAESSSMIYLCQGLGLDAEYIMLLCSYYAKRERITVRFIEKKAISLYDDGVKTLPALEAYLSGETKRRDVENTVRKLFGLGERALVPREREYISNWTKWEMSDELIRCAYEETVTNTDRPTLAYANAILENWHASGVENGAQADEKKKEYKSKTTKKTKKTKTDPGFDLDEFFDLAIARGEGKEENK